MHDEIKAQVKEILVRRLNLDAQPDDIADDEPLFGAESALELDSVDVLEFIVGLRQKFKQVPFQDTGRLHEINSVSKISQYIADCLARA